MDIAPLSPPRHPLRTAVFGTASQRVSLAREPLSYAAFFGISFVANFIIIFGLIV